MEEFHFDRALRLAGAFVACAIGSGFATGQEIMQFFTAQGLLSLSGALVTTVIFAWCGSCFMKHGYERGLTALDQILEFYFGKTAGKAAAIVIQLFLYSLYVVMIAGAGATLSEFFGVRSGLGRVLMAAASLITVLLGLSRLTEILSRLGIAIIAFSLGIGILGFLQNPDGLRDAAALLPGLELPKARGGWFWTAILYPGLNAMLVMILSCCLGGRASGRKEAIVGGTLGGLLFGVAILVVDLGLMVNITAVGNKAVPVLALAQLIHPVLALIFSVVIFCGIYTTAVPMLWGAVRQFAEDGTKKSAILACALTLLGLVLSVTDFRKLVNIIYPISGYAGIVVMLTAAFRDVQLRREQ